ncbi:cyclic nucleotide-binding domain-containing protein [Methylobacterium sp. CM6257]
MSRRIALNPKQNLFGQDEPAGSVYNVASGALCLYRVLPDGRRQVTGFAFPGDFLGLSLVDRFSVSADGRHPPRRQRRSRLQTISRGRNLPCIANAGKKRTAYRPDQTISDAFSHCGSAGLLYLRCS